MRPPCADLVGGYRAIGGVAVRGGGGFDVLGDGGFGGRFPAALAMQRDVGETSDSCSCSHHAPNRVSRSDNAFTASIFAVR